LSPARGCHRHQRRLCVSSRPEAKGRSGEIWLPTGLMSRLAAEVPRESLSGLFFVVGRRYNERGCVRYCVVRTRAPSGHLGGMKGPMMESNVPNEPVAEEAKGKPFIDPQGLSVPLTLMVLGLVVLLINGIRYGCAQDWMKMCLLLFGAFLNVLFGAFILVTRRLNDLSRRLQMHLDRKQQTQQMTGPLWTRITEVAAVPVLLALAILAGFQGHWLAFGLSLVGCGTVVVLSFTVWACIRIYDCLDRLWLADAGSS
jgi:hypothetical protein